MIINDRNEDVESKLIKVYEAAKKLIEDSSPNVYEEDSHYCVFCNAYNGKAHDEDCPWKKLEDAVNSV